MHKTIASRLIDAGVIDERQRSLEDGCVENTSIIATIIKYSRLHRKELHITSIDVEKGLTLPSVSHFAIFRALESRGFPNYFIKFVENMFTKSTTILEVKHRS